ncbi:PEP-CTERM sorting domain-containing protein [Planctomycetales bacterium ZRK34]|nr:PEP-CTERM sorting domain-containing protein [Planctomycetales bacterium ZRK34]
MLNPKLNRTGAASLTLAAAAVIALFAGSSQAGVYDDVSAWWHFDYDVSSDGMVTSTDEIRDQRAWGTTSTPGTGGNHASSIQGTPEFTATAYPAGPGGGQPYGNTALTLSPFVDTGEVTTADGFTVNGFSVSGSSTIVTRLMWDGYATTTQNSAWLYNNNFQYGDPNSNAGGGFLFGVTGSTPNLTLLFGNQNTVSSMTMTAGVWYDVAIVLENNGANDTISMYRWEDGGTFQQASYNVNFITDTTFSNNTYIGYEAAGPGTGNAQKAFDGSLDHLAVWDRALDVDEIHHAFGAPQPVFSLGINNNNSNDLRLEGEANKTTYAIGDPWNEAARAISAGSSSSVNFNFDLSAIEAGLDYIFHLENQTPQSGNDFTINASVNGNNVGSYTVNSAGELIWNIDAALLSAGSNTITLTREASSVAAYMAWDWMELSGGWQVGIDNGSNSDFAPESSAPDDFYVTNPDTVNDMERAMTAGDPTINLHFELSDVMAGYYYKYITEVISQNGQHPIEVYVNGQLVTTLPAAGDNTTFEVGIYAYMLNAGDNVITLQWADGTASGWSQFDYHRLELLAIPEPATLGMLSVGLLAMMRRRTS